MNPKQEVDVWTAHLEELKREHKARGVSDEEAESLAFAQVRKEIRGERSR